MKKESKEGIGLRMSTQEGAIWEESIKDCKERIRRNRIGIEVDEYVLPFMEAKAHKEERKLKEG